MTSATAPRGDDGPLAHTRAIPGKRAISIVVGVLLAVFVLNLLSARRNAGIDERRTADAAVVNDATLVARTWRTGPDGIVVTTRAIADTDATLASIRRALRWDRERHLRGDFGSSVPVGRGRVDASTQASLEFGSAGGLLNVRYGEVTGGAELRFVTTDSVMLETLQAWLGSLGVKPG